MTKPWADPRKPLDERLVAAEIAIANVDTGAGRRAIMRELADDSHADDLLETLKASQALVAHLKAALDQIAAVGYGAELTDTPEERADYWASRCAIHRLIARDALRGASRISP